MKKIFMLPIIFVVMQCSAITLDDVRSSDVLADEIFDMVTDSKLQEELFDAVEEFAGNIGGALGRYCQSREEESQKACQELAFLLTDDWNKGTLQEKLAREKMFLEIKGALLEKATGCFQEKTEPSVKKVADAALRVHEAFFNGLKSKTVADNANDNAQGSN